MPEEELVKDPFSLEINIHYGLRLIQKNDRGRQGINRVNKVIKKLEEKMRDNEEKRLAKEGRLEKENKSQEEREAEACTYV